LLLPVGTPRVVDPTEVRAMALVRTVAASTRLQPVVWKLGSPATPAVGSAPYGSLTVVNLRRAVSRE
jgi:hypothetical protein